MRKYTFQLLKAFYRICQDSSNKTGLERVGLGVAIVIESGIDLRLIDAKGAKTKRSQLFSEIAGAFRELLERGWIEELKVLDEEKSNYYLDYQGYIQKSGLAYSSNSVRMSDILSAFPRPLGDHWFLLTNKGEEFIKMQNLVQALEGLLTKAEELLGLSEQGLARQEEVRAFIQTNKEKLTSLLPQEDVIYRKFDKLRKKDVWWTVTLNGYVNPKDKANIEEWVDFIKESLEFYRSEDSVVCGKRKKTLYFSENQEWEAKKEIIRTLRQASRSIDILDNYLDDEVLDYLEEIGVSIRLLAAHPKAIFKRLFPKFRDKHKNVEAKTNEKCHDRFIIIDCRDVWHLGSSIKDAGKKAFRMSPVENEQERERILSDFERWWNEGESII